VESVRSLGSIQNALSLKRPCAFVVSVTYAPMADDCSVILAIAPTASTLPIWHNHTHTQSTHEHRPFQPEHTDTRMNRADSMRGGNPRALHAQAPLGAWACNADRTALGYKV